MTKIMGFLEKYFLPVADKIGKQRHLMAIRNGLISTLPLTVVGSIFVIFLNLPIEGYEEMISSIRPTLDIPFRFTVGVMALYAAFSVGHFLGESYKVDPLSSGLLSTLGFLISVVVPTQVADDVEGVINAGRYLTIADLSSTSLFGAIVTAIISVEIYRILLQKNITIKMPSSVPPAVSKSFAALIPTAVIILLFWGIRHGLHFDINSTVTLAVSPLKKLLVGNSLIGGIITVFLIQLFWSFGIHGEAVLGPIIRPMWDSAILENMEAFDHIGNAHELPNLFTEQFLQWFVQIGGSGTTLALAILFLTSRVKFLKQMGKLTIVPGIFNINEPIVFGTPIVMNPILIIPFIFTPIILTIVSYIATITGLVPMMMAKLPFTMVGPVGSLMSTNWSIPAAILTIVNFVLSLAIYYPFFKIFEKQQLEIEAKNEEAIADTVVEA
ncbi:PTS system, lactose/cellobiose family IIC component [Enterococcus phoeniculicola]|jgi:PTS system cellobiose-specific IIC component|uniref:Permease IIC component n=1 Tax=Enterococcus phoeniculicola ATCC BAA-412 TaxID=1158610 RepID=R3W475_9ENTE|nr:PTS transporter subunit EIIC [Enterococcus phoeniculicola]EOL42321.1 PTS system, lactose/cellobiose family IIC component [Enterococcus phoeniculicola ATCC BAA-412]EOT79400.1 PTS system, cellobiose-specific IIC component [Enterococcus phoeniculicola ATCC BAA-412]OJG73061.1 PTS system, lactose/cellobiose family IIC component [Enterococcus phoeniculicola]